MKRHLTEREPLSLDLLDGRLSPSMGMDDSSVNSSVGGQIARVSQLAARSEFDRAAHEAASLLEDGVNDIRVIGFYLFGVFLERGVGYLPRLVGRVRRLLADEYAVLMPRRRKDQMTDSALAWLFQNLSTRVQFHTSARDDTWNSWLDGQQPSVAADAASELEQLSALVSAMFEEPRSLALMSRLRRWVKNDLGRALAHRAQVSAREQTLADADAAEPAPVQLAENRPETQPAGQSVRSEEQNLDTMAPVPGEPLQPVDGRDGLGAPDAPTPGPAASRPADLNAERMATAPPDPVVALHSPALTALQAKLHAFQRLVARGAFAKAAVVANDLRGIVDNFDPVVYLPSLFAPYFKTLHRSIEELVPYWDATDSASWHALDQFYRTDLDGFVDE